MKIISHVFISIIFCLFLSGCKEAQKAQPVRPVVRTVQVRLADGAEERTFSGVVVARYEVQESFRVDGRMLKRLVDVGDRVRAGQVLAILDENDLRLSMESAQAEFNAARSNKEQSLTDERRYAALLSQRVVSQSEYDLKHLAADEARGRLDKADRALRLARNRLDYADLICSTDGAVTKVNAEAGQVVAPGQSVFSVARNGELEVLVNIPESIIQDLRETEGEVALWSNQDRRYHAVLREIAPAADSATRTYPVRFSLPGADTAVRIGMTATLRLSGSRSVPMARIPASSLFDQGQGLGVWIVAPESGRLSFRPVTVDRYADRDVYVHGRLSRGEIVVTAGVHKLDNATVVRLEGDSQGAVQ